MLWFPSHVIHPVSRSDCRKANNLTPDGRQLPGAGDGCPQVTSPSHPHINSQQQKAGSYPTNTFSEKKKTTNHHIAFLSSLKGATKRNKPVILISFYW